MLRANDQHPLPPKGLYIELDLSIENKGNRMSTIKHISLAFPQFEKIYTEVKPYFTARVPGTRGTLGRVREHFFPPEDFIRIPSESVTGPKMLAFEILDLPLSSFGKRAFEGERETLVFPAIRCELKVTDTEGYSTSHEFLLDEEK
jgi:hypothetical protein